MRQRVRLDAGQAAPFNSPSGTVMASCRTEKSLRSSSWASSSAASFSVRDELLFGCNQRADLVRLSEMKLQSCGARARVPATDKTPEELANPHHPLRGNAKPVAPLEGGPVSAELLNHLRAPEHRGEHDGGHADAVVGVKVRAR
jgi:hypothetical protein